jgi:hypothetical protein
MTEQARRRRLPWLLLKRLLLRLLLLRLRPLQSQRRMVRLSRLQLLSKRQPGRFRRWCERWLARIISI